eukprot:jgi/Chlat1/250/Chrsp1S03047
MTSLPVLLTRCSHVSKDSTAPHVLCNAPAGLGAKPRRGQAASQLAHITGQSLAPSSQHRRKLHQPQQAVPCQSQSTRVSASSNGNINVSKNASINSAKASASSGGSSSSSSSQNGAGSNNVLDSLMNFFKNPFGLKKPSKQPVDSANPPPPPPLPPRKTVLVAGSSGRVGRHVVQRLLSSNCRVIALARDTTKAATVFREMGLVEGQNADGGVLEIREGDLRKAESLLDALQGCDAVVCTTGPKFDRMGTGGPSYVDNLSSEEVDFKGVKKLIKAANAVLPVDGRTRKEMTLFAFDSNAAALGNQADTVSPLEKTAAADSPNDAQNQVFGWLKKQYPDLDKPALAPDNGAPLLEAATRQLVDGWERLDDVIMGGQSESSFAKGNGCAVFSGIVRVEGGGFCGVRTKTTTTPLQLQGYDGVSLMVRGDGKRYKMNLKTEVETPEFTYQASFDTVEGQWVTVDIPFDRFRPVKRARLQLDAAPLPLDSVRQIGLVLSRFEYEGAPNIIFDEGKFSLEIASIRAYRVPCPQFVLLSSAGVERNARVVTPQDREMQIPIVKLNPGGILTWKLAGEVALRNSSLPYAIVRACGLTETDADVPFRMEVAQGDCITGNLSRQEAAIVCAEALDSQDATFATFEVRRDELARGTNEENYKQLFRRLRPDLRPGTQLYYFSNLLNPAPQAQPQAAPAKQAEEEKRPEPAGATSS